MCTILSLDQRDTIRKTNVLRKLSRGIPWSEIRLLAIVRDPQVNIYILFIHLFIYLLPGIQPRQSFDKALRIHSFTEPSGQASSGQSSLTQEKHERGEKKATKTKGPAVSIIPILTLK